jgi:hypothetical protein
MKLLKMIMSLEITPNQKAIQFFEWLKLKTLKRGNYALGGGGTISG